MHIPIQSGALIPILVLLPNLIWLFVPHEVSSHAAPVPLVLNLAENAGRIAIIVVPFFYSLDFSRKFSTIAAVIAALALILYYAAWIRYFAGGRTGELMGAAMLGIPLPLAVAPVVLLLASSYLMGSWWMLGASAIFGAAHVWISVMTL